METTDPLFDMSPEDLKAYLQSLADSVLPVFFDGFLEEDLDAALNSSEEAPPLDAVSILCGEICRPSWAKYTREQRRRKLRRLVRVGVKMDIETETLNTLFSHTLPRLRLGRYYPHVKELLDREKRRRGKVSRNHKLQSRTATKSPKTIHQNN